MHELRFITCHASGSLYYIAADFLVKNIGKSYANGTKSTEDAKPNDETKDALPIRGHGVVNSIEEVG